MDSLSQRDAILLDFEGTDIGSAGGEMSILQIGLPTATFVVDAIALDEQMPMLEAFLSDRNIPKIVWDGRLGYSELRHRYKIRLQNVLDLQLVYLHERYDAFVQKCVPLSGKLTAIKEKKLLSPAIVEIELKSLPPVVRVDFQNALR